jgi:hypothetical protein
LDLKHDLVVRNLADGAAPTKECLLLLGEGRWLGDIDLFTHACDHAGNSQPSRTERQGIEVRPMRLQFDDGFHPAAWPAKLNFPN